MRMALKLLAVVLAVLLLLQGALWFGASRWFAGVARDLAPVAQLQYSRSYAWLNGGVGIRDVRVRPLLAPGQDIAADRVQFEAGGPIALLRLLWSGADAWSGNVDVAIQRMRLSAGLERDARERSSRLGYLVPFEALGCNARGRFLGTDYAELNWLQTFTDLEFAIRHDRRRDAVMIQAVSDQRPLGRIEVDLELAGLGVSSRDPAAWAQTRLEALRVGFQDRGLVVQRNGHCSRKLDIREEAFLDRHMAAVAEELEALGLFLDPAVHEVYRAFAGHGGMIEFSASPSASVPLSRYYAYPADERIRLLNAGLRHNRGPQVPVGARFFTDALETEATTAGAATDAIRVRARADHADRIELDELEDLIGQRLVIRTRQGVGYAGTLLGLPGLLVRIEVERSGRKQRTLIPRDSITEIRLAD